RPWRVCEFKAQNVFYCPRRIYLRAISHYADVIGRTPLSARSSAWTKKRPSSQLLSRTGRTRHSPSMRKRNSGVQKAATVERGRRGWRMNAWPKATKSRSCRRKTRLSPRTCTAEQVAEVKKDEKLEIRRNFA